jgi:S-adenosylmethionine:tRNA ribosyltransferase-isomerase
MSVLASPTVAFELPAELEASETPEERGLRRDDVRLLVARGAILEHRRFAELPAILERGDLLVVNTSPTLPASLEARTPDGAPAELHLSTRRPDGRWVVELRHLTGGHPYHRPASTPWLDAVPGTELALADGGRARLLSPAHLAGTRLWVADLELPRPLGSFLAGHGRAIRYGYVDHDRAISAYQTVFADSGRRRRAGRDPRPEGSAEMPSAARPFSVELVTRLVARGVGFATFTLHTGVASPEAHEPPSAEWYEVPEETAELVNLTRRLGHQVVAVGTTAVRALETVASPDGTVGAGAGWTSLVITPERGVVAVDGLITGWHEPAASHLALIEAVAGQAVTEASYQAALDARYLWHEFGDSHLILREAPATPEVARSIPVHRW